MHLQAAARNKRQDGESLRLSFTVTATIGHAFQQAVQGLVEVRDWLGLLGQEWCSGRQAG